MFWYNNVSVSHAPYCMVPNSYVWCRDKQEAPETSDLGCHLISSAKVRNILCHKEDKML